MFLISETPTPRSCHNDRDTHKANEIFFTHLFDALDKHQNSYEMELTNEECNKLMAQVSHLIVNLTLVSQVTSVNNTSLLI